MSYLIIKCEPLADQYECDAYRTPMFICDNWENLKLDYDFDVYQINNDNSLTLIKDYESPMEFGMSLYYWDENIRPETVEPTIIKKWNNRTRYDNVPKMVKEEMRREDIEEFSNDLQYCGTISWVCDGKYWVYGEYEDFYYSLGY